MKIYVIAEDKTTEIVSVLKEQFGSEVEVVTAEEAEQIECSADSEPGFVGIEKGCKVASQLTKKFRNASPRLFMVNPVMAEVVDVDLEVPVTVFSTPSHSEEENRKAANKYQHRAEVLTLLGEQPNYIGYEIAMAMNRYW